jgi:hypothetical protein
MVKVSYAATVPRTLVAETVQGGAQGVSLALVG